MEGKDDKVWIEADDNDVAGRIVKGNSTWIALHKIEMKKKGKKWGFKIQNTWNNKWNKTNDK